jgi:hypothetical protein
MKNATVRGKFGVANIVQDAKKYKRQCTRHLERMKNNPSLKTTIQQILEKEEEEKRMR